MMDAGQERMKEQAVTAERARSLAQMLGGINSFSMDSFSFALEASTEIAAAYKRMMEAKGFLASLYYQFAFIVESIVLGLVALGAGLTGLVVQPSNSYNIISNSSGLIKDLQKPEFLLNLVSKDEFWNALENNLDVLKGHLPKFLNAEMVVKLENLSKVQIAQLKKAFTSQEFKNLIAIASQNNSIAEILAGNNAKIKEIITNSSVAVKANLIGFLNNLGSNTGLFNLAEKIAGFENLAKVIGNSELTAEAVSVGLDVYITGKVTPEALPRVLKLVANNDIWDFVRLNIDLIKDKAANSVSGLLADKKTMDAILAGAEGQGIDKKEAQKLIEENPLVAQDLVHASVDILADSKALKFMANNPLPSTPSAMKALSVEAKADLKEAATFAVNRVIQADSLMAIVARVAAEKGYDLKDLPAFLKEHPLLVEDAVSASVDIFEDMDSFAKMKPALTEFTGKKSFQEFVAVIIKPEYAHLYDAFMELPFMQSLCKAFEAKPEFLKAMMHNAVAKHPEILNRLLQGIDNPFIFVQLVKDYPELKAFFTESDKLNELALMVEKLFKKFQPAVYRELYAKYSDFDLQDIIKKTFAKGGNLDALINLLGGYDNAQDSKVDKAVSVINAVSPYNNAVALANKVGVTAAADKVVQGAVDVIQSLVGSSNHKVAFPEILNEPESAMRKGAKAAAKSLASTVVTTNVASMVSVYAVPVLGQIATAESAALYGAMAVDAYNKGLLGLAASNATTIAKGVGHALGVLPTKDKKDVSELLNAMVEDIAKPFTAEDARLFGDNVDTLSLIQIVQAYVDNGLNKDGKLKEARNMQVGNYVNFKIKDVNLALILVDGHQFVNCELEKVTFGIVQDSQFHNVSLKGVKFKELKNVKFTGDIEFDAETFKDTVMDDVSRKSLELCVKKHFNKVPAKGEQAIAVLALVNPGAKEFNQDNLAVIKFADAVAEKAFGAKHKDSHNFLQVQKAMLEAFEGIDTVNKSRFLNNKELFNVVVNKIANYIQNKGYELRDEQDLKAFFKEEVEQAVAFAEKLEEQNVRGFFAKVENFIGVLATKLWGESYADNAGRKADVDYMRPYIQSAIYVYAAKASTSLAKITFDKAMTEKLCALIPTIYTAVGYFTAGTQLDRSNVERMQDQMQEVTI